MLSVLLIFLAGCDIVSPVTTSDEKSSPGAAGLSSDASEFYSESNVSADYSESNISEICCESDTSQLNLENAEVNENHPIVVYRTWDDGGKKEILAIVIGGSKNGKFHNIYDYNYNGKELKEIDAEDYYDTKCELIKRNDSVTFYNRTAEEHKTICTSLDIDSTPALMPNFSDEINLSNREVIGISCDWNVFLRIPVFKENSATVDIDGNGVVDKISWDLWDNEKTGSTDTKLTVIFNGKEFVRKYSPSYAGEYSGYTVINIMDLNGDEKMEIVEFTYSGLQNIYCILSITENGFSELTSYVYGGY